MKYFLNFIVLYVVFPKFCYLCGNIIDKGMTTLRVKEICKDKGMTLADLAGLMGITPSALSQNIKKPSFDTLEKLANALGVEVGELFSPSDTGTIRCPHCGAAIELEVKR